MPDSPKDEVARRKKFREAASRGEQHISPDRRHGGPDGNTPEGKGESEHLTPTREVLPDGHVKEGIRALKPSERGGTLNWKPQHPSR
jgi:hypothetical protein